MKKFMKFFFSIIIIFFIIFSVVFYKKITLLIDITKEYTTLKDSIENTKDYNVNGSNNYSDFVYKNTNNTPLSLDIYTPLKKRYNSSPVILYVHGGSWAYGDKSIPDELNPLLTTFRNEGYTIISTSYELMTNKEIFDKQVSDIKDTVRWIYKNKDLYNFNTKKIGILGVSSGAHLSLMAAYSDSNEFTDDSELAKYPSKIKYLIDFAGPTDLSVLNTNNLNYDLSNIVNSIYDKSEVIAKFNPINYVKSNIPETLIIHSKTDETVPYESSELLYEKCESVHANAKLITLNIGSHDLENLSQNNIIEISKGLLEFIILNSPFR